MLCYYGLKYSFPSHVLLMVQVLHLKSYHNPIKYFANYETKKLLVIY